MASTSIATAYVQLVPSITGVQGQIGEALGKQTGPAAEKAGKSAGQKFAGGLALAAGAVAVAAGALIGGAKALYEVGAVFDDVSDTIRVGTGATGQALTDLENVARSVGNTIPTSFEAAGTTVADLNTRLGLSGETLQTVSSQYLEAGRILGEEVDIGATSAAFSVFKIEGDAVSGAMDTLFQVSQATGVGINTLATSAQQAAPAMGQLGFSFEETVGLVGMLDKAGINSTQTMAAMQRSLVNLAKDGEEPADAFQRVVGELEGFIETGDSAAALNLASTVFGTRGAPQFIAAIESGTLATDDLMAAMGATGDTILGVGAETMDFAESWQMFKNNALSALEPVGTAIFSGLGGAMAHVTELAQQYGPMIGEWLGSAMERFAPVAETLGGVFSELGPVVAELAGPILQLVTSFSPLGLIFKAITPILPQLTDSLKQLAQVFGQALATVLPIVTQVLSTLAGVLSGVLMAVLPTVVQIVTSLALVFAEVLTALLPVVAEIATALIPVALTLIDALLPLVMAILPLVAQLILALVPAIAPLVRVIAAVLTPVIQVLGNILQWVATNIIANVIGWVASLVTSMSGAGRTIKIVWEAIKTAMNVVWSWIKTYVINPFIGAVAGIVGTFTDTKTKVSTTWAAFKEVLAGPWRWIRDNVIAKFKTAVDNFPKAFENAKDSIKTSWDKVKAIAAAPVNFIINTVYTNGIKKTFDSIASAVGLSLKLPTVSPIQFADGSEDHRAQIAKAGDMRLWAEPETGGEAYIPLASSKRARSTDILSNVATRFGYHLTPFADGGFWGGVGNFFSGAIDMVQDIAAFLSDPVQGFKNAISQPMEALLGTVTSSPLGQMLVELPRKVVTGLIDKAVDLISGGGGANDGPAPVGGWSRPSRGRITSNFGPRWGAFHNGVDFAGGGRTYAGHAGQVAKVGWNVGYGNTGIGALINHGGGLQSYYGHNPSMGAVKVRPGDIVKAGQHVGFEGATGNVTGVHLHYSIFKNGRAVNPAGYGIYDNGGKVPPGVNVVDNRSGKPEALLNASQWKLAEAAIDAAGRAGWSRDDLDYLADRIIAGLSELARGAGLANDLARNARMRSRMAGAS